MDPIPALVIAGSFNLKESMVDEAQFVPRHAERTEKAEQRVDTVSTMLYTAIVDTMSTIACKDAKRRDNV